MTDNKNNTLQELQEIFEEYPELELVEIIPPIKKDLDWSIISQKADEILHKIQQRKKHYESIQRS